MSEQQLLNESYSLKQMMMKQYSKEVSNWISLASFSCAHGLFSSPCWINAHEFIAFSKQDKRGYFKGGIYKFNTKTGEWTKIIDGAPEFPIDPDSSVFDAKNNIFFVASRGFGDDGKKLFAFDLSAKSLTIAADNCPWHASLVYVNNKLHQIGKNDRHGLKHCEWTVSQNKLQLQYRKTYEIDADISSLYGHGAILLQEKQSIMTFGGQTSYGAITNNIYGFSLKQKLWNKMQLRLPKYMDLVGVIKDRSERFVIVFGGITFRDELLNDIFILDTKLLCFKKTYVKTPKPGLYKPIMKSDENEDVLTTFGYLRLLYEKLEFRVDQRLTSDMIQLIAQYYVNEIVYLLEYGSGQHWMMKLDNILFNAFDEPDFATVDLETSAMQHNVFQ